MRVLEVALGLSVLALLTFGFVMLTSISYVPLPKYPPFFFAKRQAMWLVLGLAVCAITACVDYQRYRKLVWPLFVAAIILLVGVLYLGPKINGARRWFVAGPISFQPSELAKYVLVLVLAYWLERMQRASKGSLRPRIRTFGWGVFAPLAITGVLAVAILKEPDLGTTLLVGVVALVLMWVAGTSAGWLAAIVTAGGLGVSAILMAIFRYGMFHQHYQVQRLIHWWLEDDQKGSNFQQHIASLALGSGGLWGVGLGNSRMKMGFLPEAHTDFILPIIGEELGLVGALVVLAAFCVFVVCGILLSQEAPDLFGLLLGTGIISIIGMQAIINIAVVTNTIPNKGMPLPFISYGGSSLVMMLGALGIVLNVIWQAHARALQGPGRAVATQEVEAAKANP